MQKDYFNVFFHIKHLCLVCQKKKKGKTIAFTRRTFVKKVMSLIFNMLSMLVIAFLPRGKCLNFMAAVTICSDFGAPPK